VISVMRTEGYKISGTVFHVGRGVALRSSWPIRIQGSLLHNDFYVKANKSSFLDSNNMFPLTGLCSLFQSHITTWLSMSEFTVTLNTDRIYL